MQRHGEDAQSGTGPGPPTTLNRGACLRQTTQSCYPSFCNRFAGTLWLLLSSLACVSFPSSTLVRRACVCFHHGIVLPDCRIKILGVCSSPISLSRGVGPCVKPNTHPSRNRLRCRLLRPPLHRSKQMSNANYTPACLKGDVCVRTCGSQTHLSLVSLL